MKRLISSLLVLTLVFSMTISVFAMGGAEASKIIIEQVYGGGGKGDTPISNSFVELYNPNETAVNLTGYTLVNGDESLPLTGTIPANGSYLIVGAAEDTSDDYLTYDLPDADQTCNWAINNKNYTIKLMNGEEEIDSVTAGGSAATKISKQKSLKRINHADTDADDDFQLILWEKAEGLVDEAFVTANAPQNSAGNMGSLHDASPEPSFTPVVTGNTRVNGYYDSTASLKLELAGRYNSGAMDPDGGSLEIVQYNAANGYAYAVSGVKGRLIAVDLTHSMDGDVVTSLTGTEYDLKTMVSVNGFVYGDMTSVAISPDGAKLAVAIQAENYAAQGIVALFDCNADGSLTLLSTVMVGVQPDMVTFADADTILTADEGEPRDGADAEDPKGSVTIVTIGDGNNLSANTVYFDSFDEKRNELTSSGVLIQKNTRPSTDFEPEYIAVSGNNAYVSLQEANAIAVLDIASKSFTGVYPLGFQDYSVTKNDLQKNNTIELKNYDNVYGIRMPDGISVASIGGKTYILTANEGDSRADWNGLDNEAESTASPTGNVTLDNKVVWFNATMWDGPDDSKAYVFGSRSFSIYEVTDDGLTLIYDSGSGFEEITAEKLSSYFNCSNDKISPDNRSGKKGPEPETVTIGTMNSRTYAFIALERIGGVMVYDITDPKNTCFINYINSREFDTAIQGDVSPEGLCFIPATDSKTGNAMLLTACEVSGTLAVYECTFDGANIPHTHTYGDEWKFNSAEHWKECSCGDKSTAEKHSGGEATCTQKAVCSICNTAYGEINASNHNLVNVKAVVATASKEGNIEFYYCDECGKYFADETQSNEIEKEDTVIAKLAPTIIDGNNAKIDISSNESVSFRSDAAFTDFIRVELDGNVLTKDRDYTLKEGSIIVTLTPAFLSALPTGEHTLNIVSASGTATAAFTTKDVNAAPPETGDTANILLWCLTAVISLAALCTMTCSYRKRKLL